jgi:hypothetical protein
MVQSLSLFLSWINFLAGTSQLEAIVGCLANNPAQYQRKQSELKSLVPTSPCNHADSNCYLHASQIHQLAEFRLPLNINLHHTSQLP